MAYRSVNLRCHWSFHNLNCFVRGLKILSVGWNCESLTWGGGIFLLVYNELILIRDFKRHHRRSSFWLKIFLDLHLSTCGSRYIFTSYNRRRPNHSFLRLISWLRSRFDLMYRRFAQRFNIQIANRIFLEPILLNDVHVFLIHLLLLPPELVVLHVGPKLLHIELRYLYGDVHRCLLSIIYRRLVFLGRSVYIWVHVDWW